MAQRNIANNHSVDYQTTSGKQQWTHSARYNPGIQPVSLSWVYRNTAGTTDPTMSDSYATGMAGKTIGFHTEGHYVLTAGSLGPFPVTVAVWGAGGGGTPTQGGGAGGGISAGLTLTADTDYTVVVGGGVTASWAVGGFPDGGSAKWTPPWPGGSPNASGASTKYGGGGRSSFGEGEIAFADIDSPTTTYLLIGGGGGGAANHMDSGTAASYGGYPSGAAGGRYYPADGNNGGGGGTQSAGGSGGSGGRQPDGNPGGLYVGGPGGTNGGGAGGGGYYGGGGGAGHYNEGGGGSSHAHPTLTPSPTFGHAQATPGTTNAWTALDPWGVKPQYAGDGAGVAIPGGLAGSGAGYVNIAFNP